MSGYQPQIRPTLGEWVPSHLTHLLASAVQRHQTTNWSSKSFQMFCQRSGHRHTEAMAAKDDTCLKQLWTLKTNGEMGKQTHLSKKSLNWTPALEAPWNASSDLADIHSAVIKPSSAIQKIMKGPSCIQQPLVLQVSRTRVVSTLCGF